MLGCFFRTLGFLLSGIPYNFVIVRISIMIGATSLISALVLYLMKIYRYSYLRTPRLRAGHSQTKIRHLIDFFLNGL